MKVGGVGPVGPFYPEKPPVNGKVAFAAVLLGQLSQLIGSKLVK